jgi:hypothetical protein
MATKEVYEIRPSEGEPWEARYGMESLALYEAQNAAIARMRDKDAEGSWLVVLKGEREVEELYRVNLYGGVVTTLVA